MKRDTVQKHNTSSFSNLLMALRCFIFSMPSSAVVIFLCYCGKPGIITMLFAIYLMEIEKHGHLIVCNLNISQANISYH